MGRRWFIIGGRRECSSLLIPLPLTPYSSKGVSTLFPAADGGLKDAVAPDVCHVCWCQFQKSMRLYRSQSCIDFCKNLQ
jgi:hypothetical protein